MLSQRLKGAGGPAAAAAAERGAGGPAAGGGNVFSQFCYDGKRPSSDSAAAAATTATNSNDENEEDGTGSGERRAAARLRSTGNTTAKLAARASSNGAQQQVAAGGGGSGGKGGVSRDSRRMRRREELLEAPEEGEQDEEEEEGQEEENGSAAGRTAGSPGGRQAPNGLGDGANGSAGGPGLAQQQHGVTAQVKPAAVAPTSDEQPEKQSQPPRAAPSKKRRAALDDDEDEDEEAAEGGQKEGAAAGDAAAAAGGWQHRRKVVMHGSPEDGDTPPPRTAADAAAAPPPPPELQEGAGAGAGAGGGGSRELLVRMASRQSQGAAAPAPVIDLTSPPAAGQPLLVMAGPGHAARPQPSATANLPARSQQQPAGQVASPTQAADPGGQWQARKHSRLPGLSSGGGALGMLGAARGAAALAGGGAGAAGAALRSVKTQAPDARQLEAQRELQQQSERTERKLQLQQARGGGGGGGGGGGSSQAQLLARADRARRDVDDDEDDEEEEERRRRREALPSLLARVEAISEKLRGLLGGERSVQGGRYAALEAPQGVLVTREQVAEACGAETAGALKGYQLVGINFLMILSRSGSVGGAILADEMGLGKTAQTIVSLGLLQHAERSAWRGAVAAAQAAAQVAAGGGGGAPAPTSPWRVRHKAAKPHLVICPASLLENWQRELRHWCPKLRVVVYYGKDRDFLRDALGAWHKSMTRRRRSARASKPGKGPAAQQHAGGVEVVELADSESGDAGDGGERKAAAPGGEEEGDERRRGRRRSGGGGGGEVEEGEEEGEEEEEEEEEEGGSDSEEEGEFEELEEEVGFQICDPGSGEVAPFDVLLTTYTMFERDSSDAKVDRTFLAKWQWSHLVADEAHALKNRNSTRVNKLMKLAKACDRRILLTGTPLQNDAAELLNLLRFLMPSLFASAGADEMDDDTLMDELLSGLGAGGGDGGGAAGGAKSAAGQALLVERVRRIMAPFILRRLKSEVASQLVAKTHKLLEVDMVPEQAQCYAHAIATFKAEATGTAPPPAPSATATATNTAVAAAAAATSSQRQASGSVQAPSSSAGPEVVDLLLDSQDADSPAPDDSSARAAGGGGGKRRRTTRSSSRQPADDSGSEQSEAATTATATASGKGRRGGRGGAASPAGAARATRSRSGSAAASGGGTAATAAGRGAKRAASGTELASIDEDREEEPAGAGGKAAASSAAGPGKSEATVGTAAGEAAPAVVVDAAQAEAAVAKLGAQKVNNIFTHLRKIALHPLLVRRVFTEAQVAEVARIAVARQLFGGQCTYDRVMAEIGGWSDHHLHEFALAHGGSLSKFQLPKEVVYCSGKLQALQGLLRTLKAAGSRVLLFSQWTQMLDVMEWFLREEGHEFVRLDGSTQVDERLAIVDRFNDASRGIFVFLLSTRAGGQGLNLVGADTVVLHDVDFNPQVDRQAEDRCHRLGQTRPVTVYRLVTRGTVDRNIWEIAQRKLELDAAIMEGVVVTGKEEGGGGEEAEEESGGAKRGKGGGKAGAKGGGKAGAAGAETRHMGAILSALLRGA